MVYSSERQDNSIIFLLRQAGNAPLLTRDDEQSLGKRKEECRVEIAERVLSFPYALLLLDQTKREIEEGKKSWSQIFPRDQEEEDDFSETEQSSPIDFFREKSLFQQFYAPNGNLAHLLREVNDSWWNGFIQQTLDKPRGYLALIRQRDELNAGGSLDYKPYEKSLRIGQEISDLELKLGSFLPGVEVRIQEIDVYQSELKEIENRVINSNIRLVISTVQKYQYKRIEFSDLVQEGLLGACRAWQTFDYAKGSKFSTYATWWIRQYIRRYAQNHSRMVRIPTNLQTRFDILNKETRTFYLNNGRDPTAEELVPLMNLSLPQVRKILEKIEMDTISIDSMVTSDESTEERSYDPPSDRPGPDEEYQRSSENAILRRILGTLPSREEKVLRMHYGISVGPDEPLQQRDFSTQLATELVGSIEARAYQAICVEHRTPEKVEPYKPKKEYLGLNRNKLLRKLDPPLPPREENILRMRYGISLGPDDSLSQRDLSVEENAERIRSIEVRAHQHIIMMKK